MALMLQPPGIATSAIWNSMERVSEMKKVNFIVNCVNDNVLMFLVDFLGIYMAKLALLDNYKIHPNLFFILFFK